MKERPIIFGAESVRAILDGRKTQTRRVFKFPAHMLKRESADWVKAIHEDGGGNWIPWSTDAPGYDEFTKKAYPGGQGIPCPYGKPGDRLWVRETWKSNAVTHALQMKMTGAASVPRIAYAADVDRKPASSWRTPIFMPRWASRITLELTEVRVERLQDITANDAREEGVCDPDDKTPRTGLYRIDQYRAAWDLLNAKRGFGWDSNPWVWVLSFKPV